MSNYYPPQPPFGAMYSSNGPVASSNAVNYPGMQQNYHQQQAYNPYWQNRSFSNGVTPPQSANGYAHHANAQGPAPPAFGAPVGQTMYGGYPNTAQYNTTPVHLQTAAPNSALDATPYTPQPLVNLNQNHSASNEAVTNDTPGPQLFLKEPVVNLVPPAVPTNLSPDLEDGELSSGELSNSADDLYADTTGVNDNRPLELPKSHASLEKPGSRKSYDSFDSVNDPAAGPSISVTQTPTIQVPAKVTLAAREQAQAIIRELHSYEIGFNDIASEGVDAKLLQSLYAEIGIPAVFPAETISQQPESQKQAAIPSNFSTSTQTPGPRNHQETSGDKVSGSGITTEKPRTGQPVKNPAEAPLKHDPKTPGNSDVTPAEDPSVSNSGKSATKPVASKPMDRKDYIARLMAAKSGKPTPASDLKTEQQTIKNTAILPSNAENASQSNTQAILLNVAKDSPKPSVQPSQKQDSISDIEAKRKAQTELARQKMEALKKAQRPPKQAAKLSTTEGPDVRGGTEVTENTVLTAPPSIDTRQNAQMPAVSENRLGAYFSPSHLTPAFNIPGLFTAVQHPILQSHTTLPTPGISVKPSQTLSVADSKDNDADLSDRPRKRQKAADFMDSTSTTLHNSLSHEQDTGVIIDISDDDANDDSEDQSTRGSPRVGRPGNGANNGALSTSEGRHKIDEVASSRQLLWDPTDGTPSGLSAPSKLQEPEKLKSKEIEIETMNRKILELQQRLKVKQIVSRAQSPRTIAAVGHQNVVSREGRLAATERIDTATEEQLLEEKERQQDMLATAEAEQIQMTEGVRQEMDTEHHTIVEPAKPTEFRDLSQASDQTHIPTPAGEMNHSAIEALRQRMIVEAELSALDADMTRSQTMLEQAKLELERIENQLSTKLNRKSLLKQQLDSLSSLIEHDTDQQLQRQPSSQPHTNGEAVEDIVTEVVDGLPDSQADHEHEHKPGQIPSNSVGLSSATNPSTFDSSTQILDQLDSTGIMADAIAEPGVAETAPVEAAPNHEQFDDVDKSSEGELEEDNMDISGSDVDEGQVLEENLDSVPKTEDVMDIEEDEDFYEPPSHVDSTLQPRDGAVDKPGETPGLLQQEIAFGSATAAPPTEHVTEDVPVIAEETIPPNLSDVQGIPNESSQQAVPREDDEYEPPEPESLGDDNMSPSNDLPRQSSAEAESAEMTDDMQSTSKTDIEAGHFLPYESPLKQFASYRFHPEYRKEVAGGYRSLTYSHDIRQDVPMCQYELGGGVCNDDSCTNQHFEKMSLPDHLILSTMGKGEGSTPTEKEKYISGLRALIFDLRKRNVKDLDAIAEAISQYRLGFMDDISKILPL